MQIKASSKFRRSYKKLPQWLKDKAKEKEKIFCANPFDPRLDTHKLHGKYKDYWAFSIHGPYRIMFSFAAKSLVEFINVGDHDIYK